MRFFFPDLTPLKDNLSHHWATLKEAWALERIRDKQKKRIGHSEKAFLPAALEVIETPPSPIGHALLILIVGGFCITWIWASIGEIDIIATARGKIIPSGHAKIIQPLETGRVRKIYVQDGQLVKAGDPLIEMDPTTAAADNDRLSGEIISLKLEKSRLEALLTESPQTSFTPPAEASADQIAHHRRLLRTEKEEQRAALNVNADQIAQTEASIDVLQADITRHRKLLPNIKERVEAKRTLQAKGIAPRMTVLELEERLIETEHGLEAAQKRLAEAEAERDAFSSERDQREAQFKRDILSRLADTDRQIESLRQEIIKASDRERLMVLRAPEGGMIQQLSIHTVGGVITSAQQVMVLVPGGEALEVEAMILNTDIGFVHAGQIAEIKVDAFPFTKYGTIPGNLSHVSRDSVQDEQMGLIYPARLKMARSTIKLEDGKIVNLSPGMGVTVEIKTGKRRIIEYLLSPLMRYRDESMRER